jgi:co-chaperonin GroES (HSP10)
MRYVKDFMLIDIDLKQHLRKTMNINGKEVELYLDTIFSRMDEAGTMTHDESLITHKGKIIDLPAGLSKKLKKDGITLDEFQEGDDVYFHHHSINFGRRTEDGHFFYPLFRDWVTKFVCSIYCKVKDGEVYPVSKWNICKQYKSIYESTTIIIPDHLRQKKREDLVELYKPSKFLEDELTQGDTIVINPEAFYIMKVEGEEYIFVHDDDIHAIALNK